jgi:uncharacterized protein (DUF1015 family)
VADVKPFVCSRPCAELAREVAALPYDVFSRAEAAAEIATHPHSFLRIDKSCALLPDVEEYDPRVYALAAELLAADTAAGIYEQEAEPYFFLYRLVKDGRAQTGIVARVSIDDYRRGVIKRHENTRAHKRGDRIKHLQALGAQTGPVFIAYQAHKALDDVVAARIADERPHPDSLPLYDFTAPDGVRHTVWRVDDPKCATSIEESFAQLDALYIADGHHRAAAAVELDRSGYFLAVLFPANQLNILGYNRVVSDLFGQTVEQLLARIGEHFELSHVGGGDEPYTPRHSYEFGMYLDGGWYRLEAKPELRGEVAGDPVAALGVSVLHDSLLQPLLGIDDPRSSARISYVGGVRGLDELARRVEALPAPGGVAFSLFPTTLDELFAVADAGMLMPPKSTWFEPKPRSGLFINRI